MIQPGANNWIEKFFSLVENGEIDLYKNSQPENISTDLFLHDKFFKSGVIFGSPSQFIFFNDKDCINKWTSKEKNTFLLFECLLLIYLTEKGSFDKDNFVESMLEFYQSYNKTSALNILKLVFKESDSIKLENILSKRVQGEKTLSNQLWVSYIDNNFTYLDILAFRSFLLHKKEISESLEAFILGALYTVGFMSITDNKVDDEKESLISTLLKTPYIMEESKQNFQEQIGNKSLTINNIVIPNDAEDLYKFYLIDMAILTLHSDISNVNLDDSTNQNWLNKLCEHLDIDIRQIRSSIFLIEKFVMENNHKIVFLQQSTSYDKLYSNFSKRWIKILGRNKDKLVIELNESKELIALVNKSLQTELSEEEKEKVKTQFSDLVKTLPAFAIFMLPGGMILLPLILKIIPDLIPSAFRNNELPKQEEN